MAVAVSGGSDSTALLVLAAGWARAVGAPLSAVTLDHGLRPEAAAEAAAVGRLCAGLGVAHEVLGWAAGPQGNVMADARAARYRLIADWAAGRGIGEVLLGHTRDDVAETFLMRLSRAAGVDGLAAMRAEWRDERGVRFRRPLISRSREELRAFLRGEGIGWAEDPTNADPAYLRSRARQAMAALAPLGIGAGEIAASAGHLAEAREALERLYQDFVAAQVLEVAGELHFPRTAFLALPAETRRRFLAHALRYLGGEGYPPRSAPLSGLAEAVRTGGRRTLAGCLLRSSKSGEVRLGREPKAVAGLWALPGEVWDGRWLLTGPDTGCRIGALGAGLDQIEGWRATGLDRTTLAVTPAVWREESVIAAPLAGMPGNWQIGRANNRNSLQAFLMSH